MNEDETVTQEELDLVVSEYEKDNSKESLTPQEEFRVNKEKFKREKSRDGFESGVGGFKRA